MISVIFTNNNLSYLKSSYHTNSIWHILTFLRHENHRFDNYINFGDKFSDKQRSAILVNFPVLYFISVILFNTYFTSVFSNGHIQKFCIALDRNPKEACDG